MSMDESIDRTDHAERTMERSEPSSSPRRPRVGFSNSIMFREVLRSDTELCRGLLERVLGFPIERIEEKHLEYALDPAVGSHGVRYDLYVRGDDKVIDCEMQATSAPAVGRRMRYYQAALDVSLLPKGRNYPSLPESYIVFLCKHDPFFRDIPRYTIEPRCHEDPSIELACDTHWLVCNASAFEREQDGRLRALLSYIQTGEVDETDPLVVGIDAEVDALNASEEVMEMVWTQQDEIELRADIAYEKGMAEGEARGESRLSALVGTLLKAGRIDDIERVTSDSTYRDQLLKEYAIV